jgi:hypothetical protein
VAGGQRTQRRRTRISPQEAAFIEAALLADSPVGRKHALQRLCSLYRQGARLAAPRAMKGLILNSLVDLDEKVRRWAFNALAQLGEAADVLLMLGPWKDNRSNAEVFEAGLTAMACLLGKEELLVVLREAEVQLDAGALMALGQQTDSFRAELDAVRLDVNQASDGELRSATLLIGLKKAPDTLFSGRFPVADVIGELNTHPDRTVAQYSFWATVEHPDLGLANVSVQPSQFSQLPPNVQGWAYRALMKDGSKAVAHYDTIVGGSESDFSEVREGVAIGLREIYYDSLDVTVADWFTEEANSDVRDRLLEHMATHITKSTAYRDEVMKAYRDAASGSVMRSRLEAANRDEAIALEMRRIAFQMNDPDLFASMMRPHVSNQNFYGVVNAGGISNSGVGNTGHVQVISVAEAQAKVVPLLQQLQQALEASDASDGSDKGVKIVKDAIASPTKSKVENVLEWLKAIKDGGDTIVGLSDLASTSYDKLSPFVDYLPNIL